MVKDKQNTPKRRTPGNPFGQNETGKYDLVYTVKMDSQGPEQKLLDAASNAGLNKSDLIRRCLKHLPAVIAEARAELEKLLKQS
jgi:hypothetical protein